LFCEKEKSIIEKWFTILLMIGNKLQQIL